MQVKFFTALMLAAICANQGTQAVRLEHHHIVNNEHVVTTVPMIPNAVEQAK